jgi:murein DD-endopeptidase MepM/ murein hydrolase activator NlpD
MNESQLFALAIEAGASPQEAVILAAIAMAESGGNPNALNPNDNNGRQSSYGLWQISTGTHAAPAQNWNDPLTNARLAVQKLRSQGWKAWGTYTSGAYERYLGPAQQALSQYSQGIYDPSAAIPGFATGGVYGGTPASTPSPSPSPTAGINAMLEQQLAGGSAPYAPTTPGTGQYDQLLTEYASLQAAAANGDIAAQIRMQQILGQLTQSASSGIATAAGSSLGLGLNLTGVGQQMQGMLSYPFAPHLMSQITQRFHADPGEWGIDIGMNSGTDIYAPAAGTLYAVNNGDSAWGLQLFLQLPDGTTIGVGHLKGLGDVRQIQHGPVFRPPPVGTRQPVYIGQVQAGQVIGISGGAYNDPFHGNTTGPHIEFQLIRPGGNPMNPADYIDPTPWLTNLFAGKLQAGGQLSSLGYPTPDGHFIFSNSQEDQLYTMAAAAWRQVYGTRPPWSVVQALQASGVHNEFDLQNAINQMPSSISGMNIGQFQTAMSTLDSLGKQYFNRPMPQSLLRQLAAQGITSPQQMQEWFMTHPATDIPQDQFQALADYANSNWSNAIWGEPPSPDQIAQIWSGGQAPAAKLKPTPQQQIQQQAEANLQSGGTGQAVTHGRPVSV